MKHIIIVETPDNAEQNRDTQDMVELQTLVCTVIERLFHYDYSEVFVQSCFCEDSAIAAVKKMYNVED